jgi:hypothetical protein
MAAVYDKMGIRFQYPENWTLDEKDAMEGEESVTVYSPGGGFWSVVVHPRYRDPAELAEAAVEALKQEYEGIESEPVTETVADYELSGYDMNFFYLDLTVTSIVRGVRAGNLTLLIYCQADDREFVQNGKVFQAITFSLLKAVSPTG